MPPSTSDGPRSIVPSAALLWLTAAAASPLPASPPPPHAPRAVLEGEDEAIDPATINLAIDRGVSYLLRRQELDGSWRADEGKYASGQTALCVYTLTKAGVDSDHPSILRALAFLAAHPPRWTYGIGCALVAYQALGAENHREPIEELTETLLDIHGTGFSYPGSHEDLSLTQYGCLGMRAAEAAGLEIPHRVWRDCIDFALRLQRDDGSFSYLLDRSTTGSMTAAGIAVLQIARGALAAQDELSKRADRELREAIDAGVAWLATHMLIDRNPDPSSENQLAGHMTRWHLYYLYGLERVGGLTGLERFGDRDWYREAATHLLAKQGDRGQWATAHGEPHPGTCFAILVLKRATAPSTGADEPFAKNYGGDDPAQPVSLRATGDTPLTAWISSWGTETREAFEWDGERGDGPRVVRVEYVDAATQIVLATIDGDPERPSGYERFAAQFEFAKPGAQSVFARAVLRPIGDEEGEELAVVSPTLSVEIDGVMTLSMREAMDDFGRDQLDATETKVSASSEAEGKYAARFARDGTHANGWLAAPDDAEPWIEVTPRRPQRADHVVLTPYYRAPDERDAWGRAKFVRVEINRKEPLTFDIDPDEFGKAYLALAKPQVVRRLRVTILDIEPGVDANWASAAGFAEVELQLRD